MPNNLWWHASSIQRPAIQRGAHLAPPLTRSHEYPGQRAGRSEQTPAPAPDRPRSLWVRILHAESSFLALAFGMAVLGWAYWPNLQYLYTIWDNEPNYSHGILVIPIALVIFSSGWRT